MFEFRKVNILKYTSFCSKMSVLKQPLLLKLSRPLPLLSCHILLITTSTFMVQTPSNRSRVTISLQPQKYEGLSKYRENTDRAVPSFCQRVDLTLHINASTTENRGNSHPIHFVCLLVC